MEFVKKMTEEFITKLLKEPNIFGIDFNPLDDIYKIKIAYETGLLMGYQYAKLNSK